MEESLKVSTKRDFSTTFHFARNDMNAKLTKNRYNGILILTNLLLNFFMKELIYNIAQIILAVLLVIAILLQQKGSGLGGVFGGSSNVYSTKRGVDKILFYGTIVISTIFFVLSFVRLIY